MHVLTVCYGRRRPQPRRCDIAVVRYAPKNNPSVHVASALARQLGACSLFRCEYRCTPM